VVGRGHARGGGGGEGGGAGWCQEGVEGGADCVVDSGPGEAEEVGQGTLVEAERRCERIGWGVGLGHDEAPLLGKRLISLCARRWRRPVFRRREW
jgi:hypothetical protein